MDAQKLAQLVSSPGKKSQPLHVALWNLDRVDQQELPLDRTYRYGTNSTVGTGSGVTIYILDSGVRASHREFRRWTEDGIRVRHGYDFVDDDPIAEDCTGHGTHVASTAIGRSVGIAKQAEVVAIRVLGCDSRGNVSTTVAGECDFRSSNTFTEVFGCVFYVLTSVLCSFRTFRTPVCKEYFTNAHLYPFPGGLFACICDLASCVHSQVISGGTIF